jgi:hypothetical protein
VEEALKEVFEGKKMVETLLQSQSNLKVEGLLCNHYLTSSWGWRGVVDKPLVVLETLYETLDRLDQQFADGHFESHINSGANNSYYFTPSLFNFDVSSWDQLERDPYSTWSQVRLGMFLN